MSRTNKKKRSFRSTPQIVAAESSRLLESEVEERKRVEAELRDSNRRLQEALDELKATQEQSVSQERLRALGQMASGIAHDFNNALSPVLGFSDLMLAHPAILDDKEAVLNNLSIISTGARDAANVVSRFKEFYRKRKEGAFFLPLDLNAVITQAISLTQPKWKDQALAQGITISIKTNLNKLPIVSGNESELRQALTNLIFNAVDAMPEGGEIVLRTYGGMGAFEYGSQQEPPMHPHIQTPTHVVLEVSDTGLGMNEETRQRCLEPFFTTKGDLGTGLGLSMVFGIVTRHEGIFRVESKPGKGTTFTIQLPVLDKIEPATASQATTQPIRPLRVLIVDDEPMVRSVLTALLNRDGHTVEAATTGREGLEKFQVGTYDLVLTDRGMPEMNGDQMALLIKQISPMMPVVMATGFGDIMQGKRPPGVDVLLTKPIKLSDLRNAIAELVHPVQRVETLQTTMSGIGEVAVAASGRSAQPEAVTGEENSLRVDGSIQLEGFSSASPDQTLVVDPGEGDIAIWRSQPKGRVMIVDDDEHTRELLQQMVGRLGYAFLAVSSGEEALQAATRFGCEIVLVDYHMPGGMDGVETIESLRSLVPDALAIMITGFPDFGVATRALREAAFDFLCKPIFPIEVELALRRAVEHREARLRTRLQQDFLSIISHELMAPLQTPMRIVENFLSGLYGNLTDKQKDRLKRAFEGIMTQARLMGNLLDFSYLESGRFALTFREWPMADIVGKVIESFEMQSGDKDVKFEYRKPSQPFIVSIDADRIKEALGNILSNAIKHSPQGGNIVVELNGDANHISCTVSDEGPGIPSEFLDRIFEKRFQVTSVGGLNEGLGIGLYIARQIAIEHGGEIAVRSEVRKGSVFTFTLPLSTQEIDYANESHNSNSRRQS